VTAKGDESPEPRRDPGRTPESTASAGEPDALASLASDVSDARRRAGRTLFAAAVLVAVAMRVNNAFRYRMRMGFDAVENVEYVQQLLGSWALPAPDAGWATSHPPLFYYASAAVGRALARLDATPALIWMIPLGSSAVGLIGAWAAWRLVRRSCPEAPQRARLAALLVLFAPVHVYMSAMFSEEILAATWSAVAVVAAAEFGADGRLASGGRDSVRRAAWIGLLAGLAWLTKLSGLLVLLAIATAWAATAWRRGQTRSAVAPIATLVLAAAVVGGWFYARNLIAYGYLYPQDLEVHAVMFEMPPGERGVLDYLRLPMATFSDPQLLNPDLLHSVWGSTYTTLWFDGHRHFLPNSVAASRAGSWLLGLALLPTAAFAVGLVRGAKRWWQDAGPVDGVLLSLVGFTGAGYVVFTWSNPWFATLKGSYLLGAGVPFAYYASETLERWASAGPRAARIVYGVLGLLFVSVALVFTIGVLFTKIDATGLPWRSPA
jgi:hypothetical protein